MGYIEVSRSGRIAAALSLAGLLILAPASGAGTGRLLSGWMSEAPAIDGELDSGEWSEAIAIDLGTGVSARVGNDGRTLYLQLIDGRPGEPSADRMIFFFDDDGGTEPLLDDGAWTSLVCQNDPGAGEGEIWFEVSGAVDFYEWRMSGGSPEFCPAQALGARQRSAVGLNPFVGVIYEVALPLDGPLSLHAAPGRRIGLQLRAIDGAGAGEVCYPSCSLAPADFRNLVLATPRCNVGNEEFESPTGLPLEWTATMPLGSGQGWHRSAVFGDPVFCGSNETAGAGSAACVANALNSTAASTSALRMPMAVAGQTEVYAYLLFTFEEGAADDTMAVGFEFADGSTTTTLTFGFPWPPPGASLGVTVPLPAGNPPVAMIISHSTASAGGTELGYVDIDNVRLVCNPLLFNDDFETGLSTHWSATGP
ncbi:MAG: hypothetical protein ABIV06_07720 [Thermoanaerobaculia bacterium]